MTEEIPTRVGGTLIAFAIGTAIGAGIALLLAPQSGRETRAQIARRSLDLKTRAGDALDGAREILTSKKAQILAAVEAGKQAMENEGGTNGNSPDSKTAR